MPDANIGIVCSQSDICVVDVDEPALQDAMLRRFGDTPLIVRTGRGRFQNYYRSAGDIVSRDLRHLEGIDVEIKASGSIVVAPPSVNFKTGGQYQFERGGVETLQDSRGQTC